MHKQTEIRDKVKKLLLQRTAAGDRVFSWKIHGLNLIDLPAIAIYTPKGIDEKVDSEDSYLRRLEVEIVLYVKGKESEPGENLADAEDSVDVQLDNVQEEVENVFLKKFQTLEKTVHRFNLTGFDTKVDATSAEILAFRTMHWFAQYAQDAE